MYAAFMQEKSLKIFDRQIQRIQTQLAALGPMRPGTLTRQYRQPQRQQGAYYQISYTYQMKSHRVCAPTRGGEGSPRDRDVSALQETHRPMGGLGVAAFLVEDAVGPFSGFPIPRQPTGLWVECGAVQTQKDPKIQLT